MTPTLSRFLLELFSTGRVRPGPVNHNSSHRSDHTAADVLEARDTDVRPTLAFEPPPFDADAAFRAASLFRDACALLVDRTPGPEVIERRLPADLFPNPSASPAVHYSVDLTFAFLPDLHRLAKAASEDDPLTHRIFDWAVRWPLSSAGMNNLGEVDLTPFEDEPSLRTLYKDRVESRAKGLES